MPVRHVVVWSLNDPADAPRFKALLETCRGIVPGMLSFEVGIRTPSLEANADVVLVSTFSDAEALDAYQRHPLHQAAGAQLGPMRKERRVLDYPVDAV